MIAIAAKSIVTPHLISLFKKIVGEQFVFTDDESLEHYSHDETETLSFLPAVVIKPRTAKEISLILEICNKET